MEKTSKKWYTSKLLWIGVVQVLIATLALFEVIAPHLAVQLSAVSGALVVVLRTLTGTPLSK